MNEFNLPPNAVNLSQPQHGPVIHDPGENKLIRVDRKDRRFALAEQNLLGYRLATEQEAAPRWVRNWNGRFSLVNWDNIAIGWARTRKQNPDILDAEGNPTEYRFATAEESEKLWAEHAEQIEEGKRQRAERLEKLEAKRQLRDLLGIGGGPKEVGK